MQKNVRPLRLLIIQVIFFFFLLGVLPAQRAEAATIYHKHTGKCYSTVTKTCSAHRIRQENRTDVFHCVKCQDQGNFNVTVWWEICENEIIGMSEVGRVETCARCGYVRKNNPTNWQTDSHTYSSTGLTCGKSDSTPVASLSLSASTSEPTNGTVTISAEVSALDSSYSASENPLDFGNGFGSATSMEVSENGTYTVTLTDANGNTASDSITVSCIDKTAPAISSLTKSTDEWIEEGLTITVEASDETGLAAEPYSLNGGAYSAENSWHLTANGTYTVSVKDAAGNVTSESITIENIGRDPAIIAAEKAAAEKAAAEKAAAEKAAAEKAAAEKAAAEKAAAEKAAAEAAAQKAASSSNDSTAAATGKTDTSSKNSNTTAQNAKLSETKKSAKAGLTKDASKSSTSGNDDLEGSVSQNDLSANDLSSNDKKSDVSGNTVYSKDLTGTDGKNTGKLSDIKTIESISEIDSLSENAGTEDAEETPVWTYASINPLTIGLGLLLVFGGSVIASFFNYIYISENGHKKILTLCRVRHSENGVRVIVPKGKLKKHGRCMIYFSLWNRFRVKQKPVTVEVEGEQTVINTDDRIAFKY